MAKKDQAKSSKKSKITKSKRAAKAPKKPVRKSRIRNIAAEPAAVEEKLAPRKKSLEPVAADLPSQRLTGLLDSVQSGICLFTKDDRVEYCNRRFSEITSIPAHVLIGKKLKKNALWGGRAAVDEFQVMFARVREGGSPMVVDAQEVGLEEGEQKLWKISLLPQHDDNGGYKGMGLAIEDVTDRTPRISNLELVKQFFKIASCHASIEPLIEDVAHLLKDYSRCSSVKITLIDKLRDIIFKAETGAGSGLWENASPFTPAVIDSVLDEAAGEDYLTKGGSIYIGDIVLVENDLRGQLKETVVNTSNSYGFRSLALVPVKLEDRITGFIQMGNKKAGGIPSAVIETVENIAEQLKLALDRVSLKEEMQKERESLLKQMHENSASMEALNESLRQEILDSQKFHEEMRVERDFTATLGATDSLEDALDRYMETAMQLTSADAGSIYMVDKETGDLLIARNKGFSASFGSNAQRIEASSATAQTIKGNKPVYKDVDTDLPPVHQICSEEGLQIFAVLPVVHEEIAIACLLLASRGRKEVSSGMSDMLEVITAYLGSVIARIMRQQAIVESQEPYRLLFSSSAGPILITDMEGNYMDANDAALAFLECTRDELLAMNVKDTLPPYLDEKWLRSHRVVWEEGGIVERDYYVWGKIKAMQMTVTPLQIGDRKMIFNVGQDMTERSKSEVSLRQRESRYRGLVESVGAGLVSSDANGVLTYVNAAICKMTGYSVDEMVGTEYGKFIHKDDLEATIKEFGDVKENTSLDEHVEFRVIKKDGDVIWIGTKPTDLIVDGQKVGFTAILNDITEVKRSECQLHESEKKLRELADELQKGEDKVSELVNQLQKGEEKVHEIADHLQEREEKNREMTDQLRQSEAKNRELADQLQVREEKNNELANQLRESEEKVGKITDQLQEREAKNNELANQLRESEEKVGKITDQLQVREEKNNELANQLRESEEKVGKITDQLQEREAKNREITDLLQEREAKNRELADQLQEREQTVREITDHLQEREAKNREITDLLQEREAKNRELADQLQEREQTVREITDHLQERETKNREITEQLQKGEAKVSDLADQLKAYEAKNSELENQLRESEEKNRELTIGVQGSLTDISAQKQYGETLKPSERRYRLLVDNALDVIWTTNMDLEIDYVSPSARYMIGRSPEEIINMSRQKKLTAEYFGVSERDAQLVWKGARTLLDEPSRTQSFELEFKHPEGFISWTEIKMSVMREKDGKVTGILGTVRDITHQKKMTQRLISTDRLASLGEMAAGLAHEVSNPLTAVMGFTYLLQKNPNISPEIRNDVDAVFREGKRAADVIKNFLIFARGEKPEKQAIYINDIVNEVLKLRRSQMESANIEVSLNLAEDLPAVQGDISQLQQVFLNIVLNAEHFMYTANRRGTLTISTSQAEGVIKTSIADDGPGIQPERLNRVFDPFYTTKGVGEGTGLGLSICYGIVREHGGNIYAESEPGKGAVFTVELPAEK